MSPHPHLLQRLLEQQRYEEAFETLLPMVSDKVTTRKNVLSGWRSYLQWLTETGESLTQFRQPEVDYLDWLKAQEAAPSTLNNRLVQVRKLYALLVERRVVERNPFVGKKMEYNPVEERRKVYSREEVDRLLAHADSQERLMVLLATEAGLSGGEVRYLKFRDILEDGQALQIWRVRYRQEEFSPVQVVRCSSVLQHALQQWMQMRGAAPLYGVIPEGHVFEKDGGNIFDHDLLFMLYQLCQRANVEYKPWRALKHVAGVQRLASGASRTELQKELGVQRLDPLAKKAGLEDGRKVRWRKQK